MVRSCVLLACLICVFAGCHSVYQSDTPPVPVGPLDRDDLPETFLHGYPQPALLAPFPDLIRQGRPGVQVIVFMGTWCSDSKREVPRFLMIADSTGMKSDEYTLYGLDRKKTSPDGLEQQYHIEKVPTFIFLRGTKEIGRIVETPRTTLEGDIVSILAGSGS